MDYKSAGVDIVAGNEAVNRIKPLVKQTFNKHVLGNLGSFASFFELPKGYKEPVMVSCTDGVGTKLRVAIDAGIIDTVGIDLVAMSVNDLICCGAKPLYFLDYIACHSLIPQQMESIIKGMTDGCLESGCALIGGEMAEMNDMYHKGDFDLAGFAVGVVEKSEIIDGSKVKPGQFVYALPSSGIHSNGYSLVRKILDLPNAKKEFTMKELLEPTKIYVKEIEEIKKKATISAIAHITGGGLKENIERLLPKNVDIKINKSEIRVLDIFKRLQNIGDISENEMMKVFNMGVGMVVITNEELLESQDYYRIGVVEKGAGNVDVL